MAFRNGKADFTPHFPVILLSRSRTKIETPILVPVAPTPVRVKMAWLRLQSTAARKKICTAPARNMDPDSTLTPFPTKARGKICRSLWLRPREEVQTPSASAPAPHSWCQKIIMVSNKIKEGCRALVRSPNGQRRLSSARVLEGTEQQG